MPAREGEISVYRAARILEVNVVTVRRWCRRRVRDESGHCPIQRVRRSASGQYWVNRAEIRGLKDEFDIAQTQAPGG